MFNWTRGFTILLLIGLLLLPAGAVKAKTISPLRIEATGLDSLTSRDTSPFRSHQIKLLENPAVGAPIVASATNLVQDPSFEGFTPPSTDPSWSQSDNYYGTPLCNDVNCGYFTDAHPNSGSVWAWFGGAQIPSHIGSLSQVVTFPYGGATLAFYFWIGYAQPGSDANDVFYAKVDGVTVFSANATQAASYPAYTLVSVNVSSFANGAAHTIQFSHVNTTQDVGFHLDDVGLFATTCSTTPSGGAAKNFQNDYVNDQLAVGQPADNVVSPLSAANGSDTVGVFRPTNGLLYLKNTNTSGFADVAINYGLGGDCPVVGDWDGNGTDTIGIYRNGVFYLRNSNTVGFADLTVAFGTPGDQPIAGDWNNDGVDTIGVYRSSTGQFLLRNSNTSGAPEMSFYLGNVGDVGIAGDWNGDGTDTTGVFRPSNGVIFLKNTNVSGFADVALNYGLPGDQPVVGDWDNNGTTTIGIYRSARFYLRNSNTNGFADILLNLGNIGDMPIAGNWDGIP